MAALYRRETAKLNIQPIFFLAPTIYKLETPFNGITYIYAEPNLGVKDFQKFTNNYSHCVNDVMASFSHFSYEYSAHYFMINDL